MSKKKESKVKVVTNKNAQKFLESYLNNTSPVGYEESGHRIWLDYMNPYMDEYIVDNYGSVAAVINPGKEFKVVIEAHSDEISWYVNYITDDGYIYVIRNGGSDHQIAPAMRVTLHGDKGAVDGHFGWPAIHTRRPGGMKEQAPSPNNIFIDMGCSSKEEVLEKGVKVGTVITFNDGYKTLNDKYHVGRALDNRMGGFVIAEVARLLKTNKKELPFTLYVTNCVQEEVGLRGAEMMTQTIKPDLAIITDVTHDTTTPMLDKKILGDLKCGRGPVLDRAPAVHRKLYDIIEETAKKEGLQLQYAASSRVTGTDTDAFAYSNGGVISALLSFPLKYMHTTVETVAKSDVEETIQLIYHTLLNIDPKKSWKYLD